MTVVDQIPLDTLDDPQERTPVWHKLIKQRGTEDERRLIPRGTYEATLLEVTLVRRKDGGGFVVRMIARTDRRGVYLTAWRGLSANREDAFDLTDNQVKSLRKFAESMGIPVPAPAPVILEALYALAGGKVQARVVHTPAGLQATFSREGAQPEGSSSTSLRVGGQVIDILSGEVMMEVPLQGDAQHAFEAHQKIVGGQSTMRVGFGAITQGCHELRQSRGWLSLGYETLSEYLAQPDVELSKSEFERAADIWQTYVLDGGAAPQLLQGASPSKLEVPLPALKQGLVDAERAAADAESMTRRDLREHYRALLGDGEEAPVDADRPDPARVPVVDVPAGGTDVEPGEPEFGDDSEHDADCDCKTCLIDTWGAEVDQLGDLVAKMQTRAEAAESRERALKAELDARPHQTDLTHHALAHGLVRVLDRVLREVGNPARRQMSKDLRAAVVAALDEARENGIDAEG